MSNQPSPAPPDNRFRSDYCEQGKHDECAKSSMIRICGCECHDYLDEMDRELYG